MRDDEIDRILGGEDDILPSPRFPGAVMRAIHREAATPPPIPFPWKRAWPALAAGALALVVTPFLPIQPDALLPTVRSMGAPWIALAALVTIASLLLSKRFADERF